MMLAEKKIRRRSLLCLGWLNLPPKFDIELLFIYVTQNNYYVQKGGSYHTILFE
jgi:hypothetical protein